MENVKSCSLAELENMEQETYQLLDIRSMEAFDHGHLKDALNIPANELIERKDELQTEKKIIVYCQSGVISTDQAELLSGFGFDACSLEGGYDKWLLNHFQETARNADIEKSIRKKFLQLFFAAAFLLLLFFPCSKCLFQQWESMEILLLIVNILRICSQVRRVTFCLRQESLRNQRFQINEIRISRKGTK